LITIAPVVAGFAYTATVIHITYISITPCATRVVTRWSPDSSQTRVTTTAVRTRLTARVRTSATVSTRQVIAFYAAATRAS